MAFPVRKEVMRQRIHACFDRPSTTYWGRVKPGSREVLRRAMERIFFFSERENLIEDVLLETQHWFACGLEEPPKSFRAWREELELEWLVQPDVDQGLTDNTTLYESAVVTHSRVEKVELPSGLVFLGHIPRYGNQASKELIENWPVEQFKAERRALREEIARLTLLHRDMPNNVLRRLARKDVGLPPSMPEEDDKA